MTTYSTITDGGNGVDPSDEVATLTEFDGAGRVRRTRTENPNAPIGTHTGKLFEYDNLGRVKRETVPAEISISGSTWTPVGDDVAGWLWNEKQYDWKDRVTRTIPSDSTGSDGKDTLIEYAGCGCAGGQITTIKGPQVIGYNAAGSLETTAKRRMQKAYEDILGRSYKSEIYDFSEKQPVHTLQHHENNIQWPRPGNADPRVFRFGYKLDVSGHDDDLRRAWAALSEAFAAMV